jgi:hypothetical protein
MQAILTIGALMHGWPGLTLAYTAVQVPMLAGMVRARAELKQLMLSPMVAAPLTAMAGLGLSMLSPALHGIGLGLGASAVVQLTLGSALSVSLGYATGRLISAPRGRQWTHQRGARVVDGELSKSHSAAPALGVTGPSDQLTLAGLAVPKLDESKHFKLIGTTGTGKSTAIAELLAAALRRGDHAIIADPDGGYLRRFYDAARGDIILNPFDQRSVKWDLFSEIQQPYDVEQIARSLLPDADSTDSSWRGYARTFLTAVTRQAHAAGVRNLGELYRLLVIASTAELRVLTEGTPAQPFLEEHNGRMFDSIRSVTSSAVGSLEHIARQDGAPFSIREWVRRGRTGERGVLFIPYSAGQIAALRSTVSAWMRIAIFEAMEGPEQDQRLWFVVDELDALGQIDGLKDALARVRKFGGRCVLGFQSVAQVASTYGAGAAHTIIENCGSSLILRCSSSEGGGTSRFASTLIGQREIARRTLSHSRRHGEMLGSSTSSEHFSIEPAVMDSEIEQLPDLTGYLKFASQDRWQRVTLRALHRGATAEAVPAVPAYVPVCRAAELAPDAQCATSGDTRKYNATDSAEKRPGLRRRSDRMPQTFTRSRSTTVSSQAKTLAREPPEQTL